MSSPSNVAESPITDRRELVEYIAGGGRPRADWRIGTEHEKFGYTLEDHLPLPYGGRRSIRAMLEGLSDRFGWAPVEEAGNIIGLTRDSANVSLEPGGQLELSGAPLKTIHETCDEVNALVRTHLGRVQAKRRSLEELERQLAALNAQCESGHRVADCGILEELIHAAHGEACACHPAH